MRNLVTIAQYVQTASHTFARRLPCRGHTLLSFCPVGASSLANDTARPRINARNDVSTITCAELGKEHASTRHRLHKIEGDDPRNYPMILMAGKAFGTCIRARQMPNVLIGRSTLGPGLRRPETVSLSAGYGVASCNGEEKNDGGPEAL